MTERPNVTLPGKVEKVIDSPLPSEPEKAQISVDGADPLYREIRIENELKDDNGNSVRLKNGAEVEVTVEADKSATKPKKNEGDNRSADSNRDYAGGNARLDAEDRQEKGSTNTE
jgi:hypothetical protein